MPIATPPPDNLGACSVIQVVFAETAEPIDGALVNVAGRSYTQALVYSYTNGTAPLR